VDIGLVKGNKITILQPPKVELGGERHISLMKKGETSKVGGKGVRLGKGKKMRGGGLCPSIGSRYEAAMQKDPLVLEHGSLWVIRTEGVM